MGGRGVNHPGSPTIIIVLKNEKKNAEKSSFL